MPNLVLKTSRNPQKIHVDYLCQDGDLLIGAPGPYNWRGAVFKNRIQQSLSDPSRWYQSPVEDPLPGDEDMLEPATGYYSYLGWFWLFNITESPGEIFFSAALFLLF